MQSQKDGWRIFKAVCLAAQDEKNLAQVLDLLLTAEERENLAMRCLIVRELLRGEKTQREIAKQLEVSIAKITRGSNELKRFDKKFLAGLLEKL